MWIPRIKAIYTEKILQIIYISPSKKSLPDKPTYLSYVSCISIIGASYVEVPEGRRRRRPFSMELKFICNGIHLLQLKYFSKLGTYTETDETRWP